MTLKHPEYAHGISDAALIKEAIEFCDEELDGYEGMEYDDDSEVCCQRSNTFIRELVCRLKARPSIEPTEDMLLAGEEAYHSAPKDEDGCTAMAAAFKAMLRLANPSHQEREEDE